MDKVDDLLTRGVENIIPGKEKLRALLAGGKKLNIYLGIDPTATTIHIGHAVPLRKLNAFAALGRKLVPLWWIIVAAGLGGVAGFVLGRLG